jgi:uncharacterized membrane protein
MTAFRRASWHDDVVTEDSEPGSPLRLRVTRLEAFSDGVFAIAITLLVLEIAVPAASEGDLLTAVIELWPSYLGYLISFATIGALWLGHTAVTHYLHAVDAGLLRLNLLLLLVVAFIPFPTGLLAENIEEPANERVAATIYGGTLLAASIVLSAVWRYALSAGLIDPEARRAELRYLSQRLAPGLAGYVGLLVLGWFRPLIAVLGYMLLAFFLLIPVRRPGRKGHPGRPASDSQ